MSCKSLKDVSIERLKSTGAIQEKDGKLYVENRDAFQMEQAKLHMQFLRRYDKKINNPIGTLNKEGLLKESKAGDIFENGLRIKGDVIYPGISKTGNFTVGEDTDGSGELVAVIAPSDLALISSGQVHLSEVLVKTFSRTRNKEGKVVAIGNSYYRSIENIINKKNHDPSVNENSRVFQLFIDDLFEFKNIDVMTAIMPEYFGQIVALKNKASAAEASAQLQIDEAHDGNARAFFEEVTERVGDEDQVAVNDAFNRVLGITDTKFGVKLSRYSNRWTGASASPSHINMSVFNSAINTPNKVRLEEQLVRNFIHEKAHVVTLGMRKNKAYEAKMQSLYKAARKGLLKGVEFDSDKHPYGMSNIDEFLAEGLTNPDFQVMLSQVPYDETVSLWEQFLDTISQWIRDNSGYSVPRNVLEELITTQNIMNEKVINDKVALNDVSPDVWGIYDQIDHLGKFQGDLDNPEILAEVYKWAKPYGFKFNASTREFKLRGKVLNASAMMFSINFDKSNFYYQENFPGIESAVDFFDKYPGEVSEQPFVKNVENRPKVKIDGINGSIDKLVAFSRDKTILPEDLGNATGSYLINGTEFFEGDKYLGIKKNELEQVTINNDRIEEISNEVSRRIFNGEDSDAITYDEVNELAYQKAQDQYAAELDVTTAEPLNVTAFRANYKNPISKASFDLLKDGLVGVKKELEETYAIKSFNTNIVVGNEARRYGSKINILAEHKDGSFTVIDMKPRRGGIDKEFESTVRRNKFNDKDNFTRQLNSQSQSMESLGFRMNDPLLLMAKSNFRLQNQDGTDHVAENESFERHDESGKVIEIYKLPTINDLFNYEDSEGNVNIPLRDYIINIRRDGYSAWKIKQEKKEASIGKSIAEQFEMEKDGKYGPKGEYRAQGEANRRAKLIILQNILAEEESMIRQGALKGTISKEMRDLRNRLDAQLRKAAKDIYMEDQLLIFQDFFISANKELLALGKQLKDHEAQSADESKDAYFRIQQYKGMAQVAKQMYGALEEAYRDSPDALDPLEYEKIIKRYQEFDRTSSMLDTDLSAERIMLARGILQDMYNGSKYEIKAIQALNKEAEDIYPDKKDIDKRKAYVSKKRSTMEYKNELDNAVQKEIDALLKNKQHDMNYLTYLFNSDVSINNPYVQAVHTIISNGDQQLSTQMQAEVVMLNKIRTELRAQGLTDKDMREQLIQYDKNQEAFLLDRYQMKFYDEIRTQGEMVGNVKREPLPKNATEEQRMERMKAVKKAELAYKNWLLANTVADEFGNITPADKWLSSEFKNLSAPLKGALEFFHKKAQEQDARFGSNTLVESPRGMDGVTYRRLPAMKETAFGLAKQGKYAKGIMRVASDATVRDANDTTEGNINTDEDGNIIIEDKDNYKDGDKDAARAEAFTLDGREANEVPIQYRNTISPIKEGASKGVQSTDLWSLYALEIQNGLRYEIKSSIAIDVQILHDLIESQDFYKTKGINSNKLISKYHKKGVKDDYKTFEGDASVTSLAIKKMMKNRLFEQKQEYAGGFVFKGKERDMHRLMQQVTSYTAFTSMAFNMISAGNNYVTGIVSSTLEGIGGEFYTKRNAWNAKAFYGQHMLGILADMGKPVKLNIVNQMMMRLDVQSEGEILNQRFERSNRFQQNAEFGTMLMGYSMGEHEIHASIMLSVLDNTKILNRKGEWLDNDGKVTTDRNKGATLLSTYKKNEDGLLTLPDWVNSSYTEFDTEKPIGAGGEASIRMLIKDRVVRTQGAFGKDTQSELARRWYGKLLIQFKKHIIPQSLNRFRGLRHVGKDTRAEEGTEGAIPEHQKYYNMQTKTEEYGYMTSFLRHIGQVMKQAKWNILSYKEVNSSEWKKMHLHERANINKALAEFAYLGIVMTLGRLAALAAEDDDDNELLYATAYMLRKQVGDSGGQYMDPTEWWRITESPAAALRSVKMSANVIGKTLGPWNWMDLGDEYESGKNRGKNKYMTELLSLGLVPKWIEMATDPDYTKRLYTAQKGAF